jgi:hypothetical protein
MKFREEIFPYVSIRKCIRKTNYLRKVTESKPLIHNFLHIEPVELPIDPQIMELLGERCVASNVPGPCSPSKARY